MRTTHGDLVRVALVDECDRFAEATAAMSDAQLSTPTRCHPWTTIGVVAHVHVGLGRLARMLNEDVAERPDPDPLVYFRGAGAPDRRRDDVRQRAVAECLQQFSSARALIEDFASASATVARRAAREPMDRPVRAHWGPVLRLGDYLPTRILEVGVHGMDIADAIGRGPWLAPTSSKVISRIVKALLGADLPNELGWSDEQLIRVATGRRSLSEAERRALGDLAEHLPLIA